MVELFWSVRLASGVRSVTDPQLVKDLGGDTSRDGAWIATVRVSVAVQAAERAPAGPRGLFAAVARPRRREIRTVGGDHVGRVRPLATWSATTE